MIIDIKATNNLGFSYQFDDINRIVNGLDLSGVEADVNYLETTLSGSRYQNTKLKNRNFDLEVRLTRLSQSEASMDIQRENMYKVFNPECNPIRFDFKTSDGDEYYLIAYSQAAPRMSPDKGNSNSAFQRALLQFTATDPYIYKSVEARIEVATWIGNIEFDFEIPGDGREVEYRSPSLNQNVIYEGDSEDGMLIRFRATGPVVKPKIMNALTYDQIELNFNMISGDIISINTYKGERYIELLRGGVRTNIFNTFNITNSKFMQLIPGDNILQYGADSGDEFLEVVVYYRIRKVGV